MTIEEKISEYLKDLPSKWRTQLTELLCQIKADKKKPSCTEVKDCETVTYLSEFTVDGTDVSIQYTDERGITYTRSFDLENLLNLNLDGGCLADPTTWFNLTLTQKIQLLIDTQCACCSTTSTTTTTTIAP